MSKESIQEVVQKSLEDYFNDLGEQKPSNIYDMMLLTVEKPILEVVMHRAEGNQSHAAQMLGTAPRRPLTGREYMQACRTPAPATRILLNRPLP
jgi:Fis family transcriptional regulator